VDIPFIKIEGLGNDYIYVDERSIRRLKVSRPSLARSISNRNFGVGSDGLIVMKRLSDDSASMEIYNSDGSEAEFCGNGLRGTALYMKSVYKAKGSSFSTVTRWSEYRVDLVKSNRVTAKIKTSMGSPSFETKDVGLRGPGKTCLGVKFGSGRASRKLFCLSLSNPHAVVLVDDFEFDWRREGAMIEKSSLFKKGINVMFAKVESPSKISVRPWERGSGATLACGSGAAAATIISNLLGFTKGAVTAVMPGGSLSTRWDIGENMVYQEGPSRIAFSGIYNH